MSDNSYFGNETTILDNTWGGIKSAGGFIADLSGDFGRAVRNDPALATGVGALSVLFGGLLGQKAMTEWFGISGPMGQIGGLGLGAIAAVVAVQIFTKYDGDFLNSEAWTGALGDVLGSAERIIRDVGSGAQSMAEAAGPQAMTLIGGAAGGFAGMYAADQLTPSGIDNVPGMDGTSLTNRFLFASTGAAAGAVGGFALANGGQTAENESPLNPSFSAPAPAPGG